MHFEMTDPKNRGYTTVVLSHGGKSVRITIKGYSEIKVYDDPFFEVNGFLRTLPEPIQRELFETYCQLEDDFIEETGYRIEGIIHRAIKRIYELVDLNQLAQWLYTHSSFIVPSQSEEDNDLRVRSKDMNYDPMDYQDLALFSLALRFLVPIWGQLADDKKKGDENGAINSKFFELKLLKYIENTPLVELPAWDKLYRYCEANYKSSLNKANKFEVFSNILNGLASTEIPGWMRAKAVFRKIHMFPIFNRPSTGVTHSLISSLHYEVRASLRDNGSRRAVDKLRPKNNISDEQNEEERNSVIEQYKIKFRAVDGDLVLLQVYTSNIEQVAFRLDPTLPPDLLETVKQNRYRLETEIILPHQIVLMQWVLCPVLTPKSIPRLPRGNLIAMLIVTQALLWHWGFKELAVLLTVAKSLKDTAKISAPPAKRNIAPKQQQERLKELFPFEHPPTTARSTVNQKLLDLNFALNEVGVLTEHLFSSAWQYVGPSALLKATPEIASEGFVVPPSDLKTVLMSLAVTVAERFEQFK